MKGKAFHQFKDGMQTFGRSLLLPIAVMAPIGMILGISGALLQGYMAEQFPLLGNPAVKAVLTSLRSISGVVFSNIPVLFAMGVAYGLSRKEKGIAVFSAVLGYLTLTVVMNVYLSLTESLAPAATMAQVGQGMVLGVQTLKIDAMGGIIARIAAAFLTDRFCKLQLPLAFAFFSGKKSVPFITFLAMIPIGLFIPIVWGAFAKCLLAISFIFMNENYGLAVYWFMHRALIPFGLHHVLASVVRFTEAGGVYVIHGETYIGILNATNKILFNLGPADPSWALLPKLTAYLGTGQMLTTLFRVPAIGLAMYHTSYAKNKEIAKGIILTVVLTAVLGNITEPMEFSFLFIAPPLYLLYCGMCGLLALPLAFMDVTTGYIRGTVFDFGIFGLLYDETNWLRLILLGALNFFVFYAVFRFVIVKFNLKTPGREDDAADSALLRERKYDAIARLVVDGLGGKANIKRVDNCVSRLRIDLQQEDSIAVNKLKEAGSMGVFFPQSKHIHIVFGPHVEFIRNAVDDELAGR